MRNVLKTTFVACLLALPMLSWAQGKIAVVDLQEAILQTDLAQKRLDGVRNQDDYKSDKAEFDKLKDEFDELIGVGDVEFRSEVSGRISLVARSARINIHKIDPRFFITLTVAQF